MNEISHESASDSIDFTFETMTIFSHDYVLI